MDNYLWVQGDGGPLVVLQATAAVHWRGAADYQNSLMAGGTVETDYDVICRCPDGVMVIERYGRDMLVLSDSEWPGCFVPATGEVVIVQSFGSDRTPRELVDRALLHAPSERLRLTLRDPGLRLLAGADDGQGATYGFSEIEAAPGEKVCEVYTSLEAQVVVLRDA